MTEEKRRFIKKAPSTQAFCEAHFLKTLKKNICLFGFAKWYYSARLTPHG
jgi:hypothetical protein